MSVRKISAKLERIPNCSHILIESFFKSCIWTQKQFIQHLKIIFAYYPKSQKILGIIDKLDCLKVKIFVILNCFILN
jgi:hypothetical protein